MARIEKEFFVDKPFLFAIRNNAEATLATDILFLGSVRDF